MVDKLSWIAVYPELILLVMGCVILLVDLWVKSPMRTLTYVLTLVTLGVVAAVQASYAIDLPGMGDSGALNVAHEPTIADYADVIATGIVQHQLPGMEHPLTKTHSIN